MLFDAIARRTFQFSKTSSENFLKKEKRKREKKEERERERERENGAVNGLSGARKRERERDERDERDETREGVIIEIKFST